MAELKVQGEKGDTEKKLDITSENSLIEADATYSMMALRRRYEFALQAQMVAHIIRHYCREGQSVSYETLKQIYKNVARLGQEEENIDE